MTKWFRKLIYKKETIAKGKRGKIMKSIKILKSLFIPFVVLSASSCAIAMDMDKNSFVGDYDISAKSDKSIIAKVEKIKGGYNMSISGSGRTIAYENEEDVPWFTISKRIHSLTIGDGVQTLGNNLLGSLEKVSQVVLPNSLVAIGRNAVNPNLKLLTKLNEEDITNVSEAKIYYYQEAKPEIPDRYRRYKGEVATIWSQVKVLFIGNSFTYYNDMPKEIFKNLGENMNEMMLVDAVTEGSYTLAKFADSNDAKGKIVDQTLASRSDYDFVILQEQSSQPIDGETSYNAFKKGVSDLKAKIDKAQDHAKTRLYATWGFAAYDKVSKGEMTIPQMADALHEAYKKCNDETACDGLNPVGLAFKTYYEAHQDQPNYLYNTSDFRHPSYAGSYLSACVHIASILNEDPRTSLYYGNGSITQNEAKALQEVAYQTVFGNK